MNVRKEPGERVHVQQGLGYAVRTLSIGKVLSSRILRQTFLEWNRPVGRDGVSVYTYFDSVDYIVSRTTYNVGRLHANNNL